MAAPLSGLACRQGVAAGSVNCADATSTADIALQNPMLTIGNGECVLMDTTVAWASLDCRERTVVVAGCFMTDVACYRATGRHAGRSNACEIYSS